MDLWFRLHRDQAPLPRHNLRGSCRRGACGGYDCTSGKTHGGRGPGHGGRCFGSLHVRGRAAAGAGACQTAIPPPSEALPEALNNLTFEQYRNIRYRPGSSLWRGQALFEIEFFHRGYHNRQRVNIFEVGNGGSDPDCV